MTKEEYQRNLIRMFDSVRSNHKGEETCEGVSCSSCPFYEEVCSTKGIKGTLFHSYEAIDLVENWAKEHPIKTNADKFQEVFGTKPSLYMCVNDLNCGDCKYYYGDVCYVRDLFWNVEYMPPKEGEE